MEGKVCWSGKIVPDRHVQEDIAGIFEDGIGGWKEAIGFFYFRFDRSFDLPLLVFDFPFLLLDLLEERRRLLFLLSSCEPLS